MMLCVFAQEQIERFIFGYTSDLKKRLFDHHYGKSGYTRVRRPWKLVYYEAYLSEKDARLREKTVTNYGSTLG